MVDPIKELPHDLLSPLFSLLHTNQIAKCNAVSKEWRDVLLTDPIVNRVLDLRNTNPLKELETIELVSRLAVLSSHPQKEIRVNITPFLHSFMTQLANSEGSSIEDLMVRTDFPLLIATIASATKGKLAKLFLYAESLEKLAPAYLKVVVESTLLLDNSVEDLKEVHFHLPSAVSLISEAPQQHREQVRRVHIAGGIGKLPREASSECLQLIIEQVNLFTKGGLKSLTLPRDNARGVRRRPQKLADLRSLFKTIRKSRNTLIDLNLGVLVQHADFVLDPQPGLFVETWNFVKSCSSLEKLVLSIYPTGYSVDQADQAAAIVDLIIPQGQDPPPLQLKELNLSMTSARLNWESSPLRWIGTSLKKLTLNFGSSRMSFDVIPEIPINHLVDLLNSNPGLQTLNLKYLKGQGDYATLKLLQLKFLKVEWMNHQGHELFKFAYLKIETLVMNLTDLVRHGDPSQYDLFYLLPILDPRHSSTLKHLTITGELGSSVCKPPKLCFSHLQTLSLISTSSNVAELLSHCHFPELTIFETKDGVISTEATFRILRSCSPSLLEFGYPFTSSQAFHCICPEPIGDFEFPKLNRLKITPTTAFTLDLFLQSKLGNLQVLDFFLGRSFQQIPSRTLILRDLIALLRSTSRTLKELEINGPEIEDDNGDDPSNMYDSEVYNSEFYFPHLYYFEIKNCSELQIGYFFKSWTFSKITNLRIEATDSVSSRIQSQLFNFMIKSSATLRTLSITRLASKEETNQMSSSEESRSNVWKNAAIKAENRKVDFKRLKELDLCGKFHFKFIAKVCLSFSFPKLTKLSFQQSDLETEDEQDLRSLVLKTLLVEAPELEQISMIGSDGRSVPIWETQVNSETHDMEWKRVKKD